MGRKRNGSKSKAMNKNELKLSDKYFETDLFACERSPVFGRYLKAKSAIKKGTVMLKEKCIVAGPKASSMAICIGCHSMMSSFGKLKCSKCSWPLCTVQCQKSPHHILECKLFRENKILPPSDIESKDFGAIGALRALLLKINRPKDWKMFIALEHHNEDRETLPIWLEDERIIKVIRDQWGLGELFSEDEIHSACGIYEVNGFEMGDFNSFGGIFPISAMIAHECIPNAGHFVNMDEGVLEIVSLVDIPVGNPITMCYDFCFKGTDVRRRQLWRSKYFQCTCKRCCDPLELSTNFSTIVCNNNSCRSGYAIPMLEPSARDEDIQQWKCIKCSKITDNSEILSLTSKFGDVANNLQTIKRKEEFLQACKSIFHPNHFVPFFVKFSLCMDYGHMEGYSLEEMTQVDAHRKLELCQDVLKILDVITPGYSTSRGNILYEMQAAEVLVARNLLEGGKCPKALVKKRLQNSLEKLNEAIDIFELCYPLRMLADSAKNSTRSELQKFINALR